jgi:hypothetical protein
LHNGEDLLSQIVVCERADQTNAEVQTDLMARQIDETWAEWKAREEQIQIHERLLAKILEVEQRIREIEAPIETNARELGQKDAEIQRLKMEIDYMKQEPHLPISASGFTCTDEVAQKAAIQAEIRKRQLEINQLMMQNRTLEERLAELRRFRRILDDDFSDTDHRERPAVRRHGRQVAQRQEKLHQSAQMVQEHRARVIEKRAEYQEVQASPMVERFIELTVERYKLERRQAKWKFFLRNRKETLRAIKSFSLANGQRKAHLSEQLQRAERGTLARTLTVDSLVAYSDMLARLIREYMAHWQMDPAATG